VISDFIFKESLRFNTHVYIMKGICVYINIERNINTILISLTCLPASIGRKKKERSDCALPYSHAPYDYIISVLGDIKGYIIAIRC